MFSLNILELPYRSVGHVILTAIGAILVISFVLGRYDQRRRGRMAKITQLPQSALLTVLALIVWWTVDQRAFSMPLTLFTLLGISCGFLGDLFMANVFRQRQHILFGMIAFGIGHIFYMLGFREIAVWLNITHFGVYFPALLATWLVAVILWAILVRKPQGNSLQYAALGYGLFLATMGGYAVGITLQRTEFLPLAVGGVLFLLSDTLIAAELFADRGFPYIGDVIWTTYIVAQVLIVLSTPFALSLAV